MRTHLTAMSGPDFLEHVADAEAANHNDINAQIYRDRAAQWKQDQQLLLQEQLRAQDLQDRLDAIARQVQAA